MYFILDYIVYTNIIFFTSIIIISLANSNKNYKPIIKVSKSNNNSPRLPKYKDIKNKKSSNQDNSTVSSIQKSISDLNINKLKKSPSNVSIGITSSNDSISSSKGPVITKAQKAKRINVIEEYNKRENKDISSINLVVIGHVDAGKSTLMGHTLFLLGEVSERLLKKYEKEAEILKKGSFSYAWVLDETEEERNRGVTIDVAISGFKTPHRNFILLDAPGHRDFVPNMISGASQADAAVLVIDSTIGSFESGFNNGGQTREHAILAKSLGIQQIIIAINKLDACDYNQERFDYIKDTLLQFLTTKVGFKKNKIIFIPVSGYNGENIKELKSNKLKSWYNGPTFIEQLDKLEPIEKSVDGVFRLSVTDIFKAATHLGGITVSGRIESGNVQVSDILKIIPTGELVQVKSIEIEGKNNSNNTSVYGSNLQISDVDEQRSWAVAGESVQLNIGNIDQQLLFIGSVLCDPKSPISIASRFKVQIVTFDMSKPLTLGVPIIVHHQSLTEPATISSMVSLIDKSTGEIIKKSPRAIPKNASAIIEITTKRPICIEPFKISKDFGRLLLRCGTETVAAAIVLDLLI